MMSHGLNSSVLNVKYTFRCLVAAIKLVNGIGTKLNKSNFLLSASQLKIVHNS